MPATAPDIFTNVHKGIRKALFAACLALGRAGDDPAEDAAARALLREVLRFISHHGENEDLLLLPLLAQHAPAIFQRIHASHERIHAALLALLTEVEQAPPPALYAQACEFLAVYLAHMHEEEHELEPAIRLALTPELLVGFGRQSVERTAPADQRMMLGWMLPAMTARDADAFLSRLPPPLAAELRPLANRQSELRS